MAPALAGNAAELSTEPAVFTTGKPASLNAILASGGKVQTEIQLDLLYDAASADMCLEAGPAARDAGKACNPPPTSPVSSGWSCLG
jgi:hypothetical protein